MSRKTQQKKPTHKPRPRQQDRREEIKGVDEAKFADVKKMQFGPTYIYTFRVRAKVTLPAADCYMKPGWPTAKVDSPSSSQTAQMSLESGSDVWYTTTTMMFGDCHPGDTLHATVTACWLCPGGDSRTEPSDPLP